MLAAGVIPRYVVAGETHPKIRARDDTAYVDELTSLTAELGVGGYVRFLHHHLSDERLDALLAWADVTLLPYDSREQASSGVLVDSLAAGVPVVATPFPHAAELARSGAVLLVPHEDPVAMGLLMARLALEPRRLHSLTNAAVRLSPQFDWRPLASEYVALSDRVGAESL
jgi:glycosyltransferase involved in cell wall biosynthesis